MYFYDFLYLQGGKLDDLRVVIRSKEGDNANPLSNKSTRINEIRILQYLAGNIALYFWFGPVR